MHLLVVEDDERLRRALRRLLEADRHVVELASDGQSALELAEATNGIDAVILSPGAPSYGQKLDDMTVFRNFEERISRRAFYTAVEVADLAYAAEQEK